MVTAYQENDLLSPGELSEDSVLPPVCLETNLPDVMLFSDPLQKPPEAAPVKMILCLVQVLQQGIKRVLSPFRKLIGVPILDGISAIVIHKIRKRPNTG